MRLTLSLASLSIVVAVAISLLLLAQILVLVKTRLSVSLWRKVNRVISVLWSRLLITSLLLVCVHARSVAGVVGLVQLLNRLLSLKLSLLLGCRHLLIKVYELIVRHTVEVFVAKIVEETLLLATRVHKAHKEATCDQRRHFSDTCMRSDSAPHVHVEQQAER